MSLSPCTVVIVTYRSESSIGDLLYDLASVDGVALDVIVVDNMSPDRTVMIAQQFACRVVQMTSNAGYAAAINEGLRISDANQPVLILNPDLRVRDPLTVKNLLSAAKSSPHIGIFVPFIVSSTGGVETSLRREPSLTRAFLDAIGGPFVRRLDLGESVFPTNQYSETTKFDWATGAALLVTERCRSVVGDWNESFFLYCEETDFFRRAREAGFGLRLVPSAVVTHDGGGSGQSPQLDALLAINKVLYYEENNRHWPAMAYRAILIMAYTLRSWRRNERISVMYLLNRNLWTSLKLQLQSSTPS